jgi:hypothetical protein
VAHIYDRVTETTTTELELASSRLVVGIEWNFGSEWWNGMAWHGAEISPIPCSVRSASLKSGGTQQPLLYLWMRLYAHVMDGIS